MGKSREEYSEELENQYKRMERAHNDIVNEFEEASRSKSSEEILDDVYNFFLICYHLREWIKRDGKVSQGVKDKLPTFNKDNSPVQFLMCRDLANKSKHATLEETTAHKPNDMNTRIDSSGGAIFRVSKKELEEAQKRKETIHLKPEDSIFIGGFTVFFKGDRYEVKGVVQACMYTWKKFFEENDLLLPRSTPYLNKFTENQ